MDIIELLKKKREPNIVNEDLDTESYCENYVCCVNYQTPAEAMARFRANGQLADIEARRQVYDEDELDEYITEEYGCDYVQSYKDLMKAKIDMLKKCGLPKRPSSVSQSSSDDKFNTTTDSPPKTNTPPTA